MNKTVNINLAGIFFHIDEDAYTKLQRYLEAIKRSFTDSQGRSEIILDIEARIAELFNERIKDEKQVISIKEVEEVITIMGQPEDYIVDEEIFEDEPQPSKSRKSTRRLFRDTENAYIGGVSSGLSHYFDVDTLWIRLAWVCLFIFGGTGILIYILLWILMPVAETTADKLSMSGKPVNITNIEQKVKEGFSSVKDSLDEVVDKVKNKDYNKVGDKIQSTSRSFFNALGNIFLFCCTIFAKFFGIILMIVGASVLIALIIASFSVGVADVIHIPGVDFVNAANTSNIPIWIVSVLLLFAVGIPFFFLFYLGLKILANKLKSIGNIAKFTLLGIWLVSVVSLVVFTIKEFSEYAVETSVIEKTELNITNNDTLSVSMIGNDMYYKSESGSLYRRNDFRIIHNEDDVKKIYTSDIMLKIISTKDSVASISIEKNALGRSYQNAKERAGKIEYSYKLIDNELILNSYLLTDIDNKYRDQEIEITLYLPIGTVVNLDQNTRSFLSVYTSSRNFVTHDYANHNIKIAKNNIICLDCPEKKSYKVKIDIKNDNAQFKFDTDGLEIKDDDLIIKINRDSIIGETESIKTIIDSSGISIKSKDN